MNHFNPILNKYNTVKKKLKAKVTERKEQPIFQAQCSTDKDMTNLYKKYDQMNKNLDILDSQDISLQKQLEKDATAFREEKFRPEPKQYTELLDTRIQIRPDFRDKLMHGRTTFVIAHRLSTVRNSDCIMVLEQGRIIERGTHDELIEEKGRYYQLYTGNAISV